MNDGASNDPADDPGRDPSGKQPDSFLRRLWAGLGLGWKIIAGLGVIVGIVTGVLALLDRQSQTDQAARAQAQDISGSYQSGPHGPEPDVILINSSSQAVYRVVVRSAGVRGGTVEIPDPMPSVDTLQQLPPGDWWDFNVTYPGAAPDIRAGVDIAFIDANGRSWLRLATGQLTALSVPPDKYFQLSEPQSWGTPSVRAP